MKKNRVYMILIIVLTIIISNPIEMMAYSFTVGMETDKSNINIGDTLTITLSVNDINTGEKGINAIEAILEYDDTVFERITEEDIENLNNWSINLNDSDNKEKCKILGYVLSEGINENQNICNIKLIAKSNIDVYETIIKLTDITTSNGETLIKDEDKSITINIDTNENVKKQKTYNWKIKKILILIISFVAIISIIFIIKRKVGGKHEQKN